MHYTELRHRRDIKQRLVEDMGFEYRCNRGGIEDWMGEPLALHLHHRNGDNADHDPENLEFLCPNCHSQTGNVAGKNKRQTLAEVVGISRSRNAEEKVG